MKTKKLIAFIFFLILQISNLSVKAQTDNIFEDKHASLSKEIKKMITSNLCT